MVGAEALAGGVVGGFGGVFGWAVGSWCGRGEKAGAARYGAGCEGPGVEEGAAGGEDDCFAAGGDG